MREPAFFRVPFTKLVIGFLWVADDESSPGGVTVWRCEGLNCSHKRTFWVHPAVKMAFLKFYRER